MAGLLGDALSWIDSKKRIAADRLAQLYDDPVALLERAGYDVKDQLMPFLAAAASGDTPAVLEGLLSSGVAGPLATKLSPRKAQELARKLLPELQAGGFTAPISGTKRPTAGFAVASNPSVALADTAPSITEQRLADWIRANEEALSAPNTYIGGWLDRGKNNAFIEPSTVVPKKSQALAMAEAIPNQRPTPGSQLAAYDIAAGADVPVVPPKMTPRGEQFAGLLGRQETIDKVQKAAAEGKRIREQYWPGQEWWSINKSAIPEIYGPNTQQWVQQLGLTAPGVNVPANISINNRMMARVLRGEPSPVSAQGPNTYYPSSSVGVQQLHQGTYWDQNRMLSSPKVTEMGLAPYYDAPVLDDLRFGALLGWDKLGRGEHWQLRKMMAEQGAAAKMPSDEFTADVWVGSLPQAKLAHQWPLVNSFEDRLNRIQNLTPAALKKTYDPEGRIGEAYKRIYGKELDHKLSREEVLQLMKVGAIWSGAGAAVAPALMQSQGEQQ